MTSDRTSCSKATANQFRLLVHTAAYWLLHTLRGLAPKASFWREAHGCGSLRLSISDLRDLMDDPPGTARWMQYSQNGEHRMTVVVEVRVSHGYVRLQHPSRASDRTEHMDYTVGLIWTVPRLAAAAGGFSALSGPPLRSALRAQGRQQIRQRQGPRAGLRRDPHDQVRPGLAPHGADLGAPGRCARPAGAAAQAGRDAGRHPTGTSWRPPATEGFLPL